MKVIIIHGTFGNPDENWFPRLKKQLKSQGHEVRVPHFPTPQNQSLKSRCDALQKQVPFEFDDETILIGHSLGATYILNILDRDRKISLKKSILVSGFAGELGNEQFDTLNKSFIETKFNRDRIKKNTGEVVIFHGDNDPYVSLSKAEYLHQKLGGDLKIIPKGGHLNVEAGFTTFEELLEVI